MGCGEVNPLPPPLLLSTCSPFPYLFPNKVFRGGYSPNYIRKCARTDSEGLMNLLKLSMAAYPGKYLISQVQRVPNTDYLVLKVILKYVKLHIYECIRNYNCDYT